MSKKVYLSDGVYVEDQGFYIKLFTQDTIQDNVIYLDDTTLELLLDFCRKIGFLFKES